MGQHPGIITSLVNIESIKRWGNQVGQHPGMMGQHKTEWWVNMLRNLHLHHQTNRAGNRIGSSLGYDIIKTHGGEIQVKTQGGKEVSYYSNAIG